MKRASVKWDDGLGAATSWPSSSTSCSSARACSWSLSTSSGPSATRARASSSSTSSARRNGMPPVQPGFKQRSLESLRVGPFEIPVDDNGAALIPYRNGRPSFQYVPIVDVLKDRIGAGALKDKIVLVGATASALEDLRSTPVSNVLPGVEVHANMIAGMLDQDFKRRPWFTYGAEAILLFVGGVALAVLIPLLTALWATIAVLAGGGGHHAPQPPTWAPQRFLHPPPR